MNGSSRFEREMAWDLMRKVMQVCYHNRSTYCAPYKTQTTLMGSVPRAIVTDAEKEQRSMYQYIDSRLKRQYPNVRIFTMFGGQL